MPAPTRFRTTAVSGSLLDVDIGGQVGSTGLATNTIEPDSLTCIFACLAEGDGLTVTSRWQVSTDNASWIQLDNSTNTAATILCTGTAGADSLTTKVMPPPIGWRGHKYVRAAVEVGGITGVTADTYSMTLTYLAKSGW